MRGADRDLNGPSSQPRARPNLTASLVAGIGHLKALCGPRLRVSMALPRKSARAYAVDPWRHARARMPRTRAPAAPIGRDSRARNRFATEPRKPPPPMRLPFFYGWLIVAIVFVTMGIGVNARTAFSLLFPPLLAEFRWDRAVTAGAFSFGFA